MDKRMRISAALALFSLAAMTACADQGKPVAAQESDPGFDRERELERRIEARRELGKKSPAKVPDESRTPVVGEVPDSIVSAAKEDLAGKLDVDAGKIDVKEAIFVVWSDGSLGCPRPDVVYTQAEEPGYRIILEYEGQQYDYRATERGYLFLCELPMNPRPVQPTQ